MGRWRGKCIGWLLGGLIAAPVAIAPVPVSGSSATPTRIRVVGGSTSPPFLFVGVDGKPQGYEADIWRLFQTHTGIRVDLVPMSRPAARQEVLSGRADVVDLIYRTPAREALYDFSAPYASQPIGIYVDRHIRGVHDVASLHGFPVGVERGDSCSEKLASLGHKEFREYSEYNALIDDVVRGNVRIFCMDRDAADYYLYRESALARFDMAFVVFAGQPRWAVRKGNTQMLDVVERGLAQITPAEREQLRKRWLEHPAFMVPYLRTATLVLAIIVLVVALPALWVWTLRRSVARRTRALRDEKDKLRALLDASPDGLWMKDRDGNYVDCNDKALALLGRTRDEVIGRNSADLLAAPEAALIQTMEAEVVGTGQPRRHMFSPTAADGTVRKVEIVKVPVRTAEGAISGVLSVSRDITERLRTETQLRLWAHAFQNAAFGVAVFDARTSSIVAVNPVFAHERGYTPEEMAGMSVDELYPADLVEERRAARKDINRQPHTLVETEQVARDGRRFPVLLDITIVPAPDGEAQYITVYAQDITARRRAEGELRLAAVAFQAQAALLVTDADLVIQRANGAFVRLTGYSPDEVVGKPLSLLRPRRWDAEFHQRSWGQIRREGFWQGEQWIQGKDGQPKVVSSVVSAVTDASGRVSHYVGSMVDLTSEREAHARVDRMTFFDPLTELPNRNFLRGQLQHLLDEPDSRGGALLMFDLDHFKRVNDLRGHAAGDALLLRITQRLRPLQGGKSELSRLGGGTFAWLAVRDAEAASELPNFAWDCAESVRQALREPFQLDGDTPVTVTVSIGWTELVPGKASPDSVFKEAELAMYGAKAAGRDLVRQFEPAMQVDLARHEVLAHELRSAIADEALELHMQAQADREGRIVGAEALLRWTRRGGERVAPDVFVRIAEENGLILPIGDWVLQHACNVLATWATQPATSALSLAVNVSARQFAHPGFVHGVRRALATAGAVASRLKLEITESVVLDDVQEAASKLAQLRALGVRVSLDDFGTGYSSLSYLTRLPLDQLKIDRSFVDRLSQDVNDAMVARTIVGMGRGLGLEVIAEGVETEAQRSFLMAQGCDAFQGYLIARPMPQAAFEAMLLERAASAAPAADNGPRVAPDGGALGRFRHRRRGTRD